MVFIKFKLNSKFELYYLTKVRTYAQHVDDKFNLQGSTHEHLELTNEQHEVGEHRQIGVSQHLVVNNSMILQQAFQNDPLEGEHFQQLNDYRKRFLVNNILKSHPEYSWFPNQNLEESIIQDYKLGSKYISNSQNGGQDPYWNPEWKQLDVHQFFEGRDSVVNKILIPLIKYDFKRFKEQQKQHGEHNLPDRVFYLALYLKIQKTMTSLPLLNNHGNPFYAYNQEAMNIFYQGMYWSRERVPLLAIDVFNLLNLSFIFRPEVFPILFDALNNTITIPSVETTMKPYKGVFRPAARFISASYMFWTHTMNTIKQIKEQLIQELQHIQNNILQNLSTILQDKFDLLDDKRNKIFENIKQMLQNYFEAVKTTILNIQGNFSPTYFKLCFTAASILLVGILLEKSSLGFPNFELFYNLFSQHQAKDAEEVRGVALLVRLFTQLMIETMNVATENLDQVLESFHSSLAQVSTSWTEAYETVSTFFHLFPSSIQTYIESFTEPEALGCGGIGLSVTTILHRLSQSFHQKAINHKAILYFGLSASFLLLNNLTPFHLMDRPFFGDCMNSYEKFLQSILGPTPTLESLKSLKTVEELAEMSQDDLESEYKEAKESYAKNRFALVTVLLAVLMKLVLPSEVELPIEKD